MACEVPHRAATHLPCRSDFWSDFSCLQVATIWLSRSRRPSSIGWCSRPRMRPVLTSTRRGRTIGVPCGPYRRRALCEGGAQPHDRGRPLGSRYRGVEASPDHASRQRHRADEVPRLWTNDRRRPGRADRHEHGRGARNVLPWNETCVGPVRAAYWRDEDRGSGACGSHAAREERSTETDFPRRQALQWVAPTIHRGSKRRLSCRSSPSPILFVRFNIQDQRIHDLGLLDQTQVGKFVDFLRFRYLQALRQIGPGRATHHRAASRERAIGRAGQARDRWRHVQSASDLRWPDLRPRHRARRRTWKASI